jgi:hypothetical protein
VLKSGIHFPTAILRPELNIAANSRIRHVKSRILHNEISENDELERGEALICALYKK